jgi:hypothetical protein
MTGKKVCLLIVSWGYSDHFSHPDPSITPRDHTLSLLNLILAIKNIYESATEETEARNSSHAILDTSLAWQDTHRNTVIGEEHEFTFLYASLCHEAAASTNDAAHTGLK